MEKFEIPIKRDEARKKAAEIANHILVECEKQKLPLATVKLLPEVLNSAIETSETLKSFETRFLNYHQDL